MQVVQIHEPEKMPQNRHRSTVRPALPAQRELEARAQRREGNSKFFFTLKDAAAQLLGETRFSVSIPVA